MKKWIMIIIAVVVLGVGCIFLFAHFMEKQTLDKGVMENPNAKNEEALAEETETDEDENEEDRTENAGTGGDKTGEAGAEQTKAETVPKQDLSLTDPVLYDAVLDEINGMIRNPEKAFEEADGKMGVLEAAMAFGGEDAPANIGYAIGDFGGDGVPELLIGLIEETQPVCRGSLIYMAYTLVDGQPHLAFEGWYRNCYQYMGDGRFYYEGSAGAASSGFGTFRLLPDGTGLSCEEFYFSEWKDGSAMEAEFWYNTSGEWDSSVSEKMDMTSDDFWKLADEKRAEGFGSIELTPFAMRRSAGETMAENELPVRVQWAEDVDFSEDCDYYDISTSGSQSRIVFTTDSFVNEFAILELSLTDVSESGDMEFEAYPALPRITGLIADSPLAIGLTFAGDIPCYGFQYEDENGDLRRFALEISGEDGSILIREASREHYNFVLEAR